MDTYWSNKLLKLLQVQSNNENEKLMVLYLDKELSGLKLPYSIDAAGNIIVTKGNAKTYPCVVSHMDTVHSFVPNFKIYRDTKNKNLYFAMNGKQKAGIGGDDKCGVFACLYLLKTIPNIKVVFFSREEVGCKGSRNIDKKFFADCRYIIQLDRRGSGDFIQTYWGKKTVSHEFSSEIGLTKKKYKYKNATGTVTDVMKLWDRKVCISCVNLSCGYYLPHTKNEYILVDELWHSIKFTEEIINTMQPKRYTSLPPAPVVTNTSIPTSPYAPTYSQCDTCKKWKRDSLLYVDKSGEGDKALICWPCKKKQYEKKNLDYSKLPNEEVIIFACNECGIKAHEMKSGDSLNYVNGELYCDKCASVFFASGKNPIKCFNCNRIIPKGSKIIERFGIRVCEDCACPSDIVLD